MGNRVNYTLVGLFFIIIVTAIGLFMWWLTSNDSKDAYRSYYIVTTDLPRGIKKDSQVKFIGVNAGYVKNIKFSDPKEAKIEIELAVQKDLPIKKDSTAVAQTQGITGISYLNIQRGSAGGEIFKNNEKAYISLEASFLDKIGDKASDITQGLDKTLERLNKILSDENIAKFGSILSSVDELAKNINSQNLDINSSLNGANEAIFELKKLLNSINSLPEHIKISANEFKNLQILIQEKIKNLDFDFKPIFQNLTDEASAGIAELQRALKEFRQTLFRLEDKPYEFFFKDPKKDEKTGKKEVQE